MSTKLSIIIVTYNCADYLKNCLVSIYNNPPSCSFDIYVVDNNSKDSIKAMIKKDFSAVKLIVNKENLGFAAANNHAIQESNSPYFLLLNPDTMINEKNTLDFMLSFLENHHEAGVAGCKMLDCHNNLQKQLCLNAIATPLNLLFTRSNILKYLTPYLLTLKHLLAKKTSLDSQKEIEVKAVLGACFMFRREIIDSVGLLDEDYFLYFEETDWCYRIAKKGWKIFFLPHVSYTHFGGVSTSQWQEKADFELVKSSFLFAKKHCGLYRTKLVRAYLVFEYILKLSIYQLLVSIYPRIKPKMQEKINTTKNIINLFKQIKL